MDGYAKDLDSFFAGLKYVLKNPPDFSALTDPEELLSVKGYLWHIVEKWMSTAFKEGYRQGNIYKAPETLDPEIVEYHLKEAAEEMLKAFAGEFKREVHMLDGTTR